MTKIISAYEARTNFGELISLVHYGDEEVIITKTGKPMVKIVKIDGTMPKKKAQYFLDQFRALRKQGKQIDAVAYLYKERNRETKHSRS